MSEIDWSKAPEGATHYWAENDTFYTERNGKFYYADGRYSGQVNSSSEWIGKLAKRPSPAWSGEGLPPVGVACEANFVGKWTKFEMRYYGDAYVVFKTDFEVQRTRHDFDTCGVKFRPIRTPEQIAADEREAAIKEMSETINTPFSFGWVFAKLYDAGWRKTK